MKEGVIIRSISGFYDVDTGENVVRLRAKGNFRKKGITPLVGDRVQFEDGGLLETILPRTNFLIRPNVANVDQALLVLACKFPEPNFLMLERFIAMVRYQNVTPILVFNKVDQLTDSQESKQFLEHLEAYRRAEFHVHLISASQGQGIEPLKEELRGKISVLAGPSGVGKSSLLNALMDAKQQDVGELSQRIQRGKNTTRVSELLQFPQLNAWIADTPGFTSLNLPFKTTEELLNLYPEWKNYSQNCYYQGCTHVEEPDCGVRQAVAEGFIEKVRYDGYLKLLEEIKTQEREYDS